MNLWVVLSRIGRAGLFAAGLAWQARVAGAALPGATEEHWIEARAARFRVFSNARPAVAIQAARHLERLADVLEQTTHLKVDGGREVRVYVFRDLDSFKPYRPFGDDDNGVTAGFQVSGEDADHIAYFTPVDQTSLGFASHEYLHAVLARNLGEIPLWVNEGTAEFYSTFQPRRRGADIGRPIAQHIAWLKEHMMPFAELFAMGGNSPDYRGGERRGTIYAQSWVLVHALAMDRTVPGRFDRLLEELSNGTASATALQRLYGPNAVDSLERHLRQRVEQRTLPYSEWSFADEFENVAVSVRDLDRVETLTILGELLVHMEDKFIPLAREHLSTAWSADSTRLLPAALLGQLAERQNDEPAASRWFETVDRASAAEPRAQALAGGTLARRRLRSGLQWRVSGPDADAVRARSMLNRALVARPEAAEWLISFGLTFLDDSSRVSEGIGSLIQAQESRPRDPEVTGGLAVLNLRAGNRGAALSLYNRIPNGPNHGHWRRMLGSLILTEAWDEAIRRVHQGNITDAESLVVRVQRTVTEPHVGSDCDGLLKWIRDQKRSAEPPTASSTDQPKQAAQGGAPSAPDPLSKAQQAMRDGDFGKAERLIAGERSRATPGPSRARLDAMAAEARNQRRLRSADGLVRGGMLSESCALYDLILGDHPSPEMRRQALRLKAKYCGSH